MESALALRKDFSLPEITEQPDRDNMESGVKIDTSPETIIEEEEVFKEIKNWPIWGTSLQWCNYYTTKTIIGEIYKKANFYFIKNENLGVYSNGDTIASAIENFRFHVIYLFNFYNKTDDNRLTRCALNLKQLYKELLIQK